MDRIANNLSRFGDDIERFNSQYKELAANMQEVVDNMNSLSSSWEGEAHDQLMQSFEKDRAKMQQMIESIGKVLENLQYADGEYNSCEQRVSSIISQIQV